MESKVIPDMCARIMIVEDETLVALELEAILGDLGYMPVGIAGDAPSALRLAAKQPALESESSERNQLGDSHGG